MSDLAYIVYLNKLSSDINWYFSIISSSIGIPCNILSIIIFFRLRRNKTNMGFLGVWQSSIDLILLLLFLLVFRSQTFGISLATQNDSACKFLTYLRRFILHASSWIPVVTTFDRFVFVFYGHSERFKFMKNKRILSAIILIIFIIITILDIPNMLFYLSEIICTAEFSVVVSSNIISIFLRTYFPAVLMILFNIVMIRKIYKNSKTISKQTSSSRKEQQFTRAVIAFDSYFFFLNFPLSLYYILNDINTYSGALKGDSLFAANYTFVGAIAGNISFFEQTFTFFMYLWFNKIFRNEFTNLLGKYLHIKCFNRVQPNQMSQSIQSVMNYH